MNNFNNISNPLKIVLLSVILVLSILGYILWGRYLDNHFVGTFDSDGLPSIFTHTGWLLMLDAWPLWLIPSLFILLLTQIAGVFIRHLLGTQKNQTSQIEQQKTQMLNQVKEKSQMDFTRALEVEELKQQVDILKHKYFEEHKKAEEALRNAEEVSIALESAQKANKAQPRPAVSAQSSADSAHNEILISSLKVDNKKLQKQVAELQEDLEQSNALIEKLLETQTTE